MNVTFFGQFLLNQGLITQEQLTDAIAFQKENNALLGVLACKHGFLTKEQVGSIIEEQRQSYLKFGKVALRKKWLTKSQVYELLTLQGQNHVYLGEALTRKNYLTIREINKQLDRFHKEIKQQNMCLTSVLSIQDNTRVFLCIYEMTCEYFYRLGYAVRVQGISNDLPPQKQYNVLFIPFISSETTYYFGLYLSDASVYQIVCGKQPDTTRHRSMDVSLKELRDIFFNLSLIICEEMRRQGVDLKAGAAISHPPENVGSWTTLRAETLVDTFYMALGK